MRCKCGCGRITAVSKINRPERGVRRGDHARFIPGHNRRLADPATTFWGRVQKRGPDECWPWIGIKNQNGYGLFSVRGPDGSRLAHRFAFALTVGAAAPRERMVLHHCDNPPCCNPAHLYAGTAKDNSADCHNRGRWHAEPERGIDRWSVRLTEDQVRAIKLALLAGEKKRTLGRQYGVSGTAIHHIATGRNWSHIS